MLAQLIIWDRAIFHLINSVWTNDLFDRFFVVITDLNHNVFVQGMVVALLSIWIYKQKKYAIKWILFTLICVGLSDVAAYRVIKPIVHRARPEQSRIYVRSPGNHYSGDSFPSNHAANDFAAATALSFALPVFSPLFYLIAFLVAYSRVYVGAHFPLDVFAGAFLGTAIAHLMRRATWTWLKK